MAIRRIKLTFPAEQIQEPVVFMMAKEFDVLPNIRRARVTETVGEMTLELEASDDVLEKAVKFLQDKGIEVDSADGATDI